MGGSGGGTVSQAEALVVRSGEEAGEIKHQVGRRAEQEGLGGEGGGGGSAGCEGRSLYHLSLTVCRSAIL